MRSFPPLAPCDRRRLSLNGNSELVVFRLKVDEITLLTINTSSSSCWGVVIGYDEGTIMVKLGREIPVASMDNTGKIIWAKHNEIQTANIKSIGAGYEVTDGERLPLAVKELGTCDLYPQSLKHNPNGRFVVVCGDGEYIIYTALAWRNRSFGSGLEFVWSSEGECAVRESSSKIKTFSKNFQEKKSIRPTFSAEKIFGGTLLAICSSDFICFYDWAECRLIQRIDVTVKNLYWADSGDLLAIASDTSFYILKYNRDLVSAHFDSGRSTEEEGVEDAFEVLHENDERVRTGLWVGDCFIYNNSSSKLNYCVGGEVTTMYHLDRPMYLLGYLASQSRVFLVDKEFNVIGYTLLLSLIEYKTLVMRGFKMGDSENAHQPSKKRGALKQLSRENPDDDDDIGSAELESGTFKKASDEVLATRRIVKIKRKEPSSAAPPAAASNPFAGIQLLPTAPASTGFETNAPLAESKVAPAEAVVEDNQKAVDAEDGHEVDSKKKVDVTDEESVKSKVKDVECGKTSDAGVDQAVSGVSNAVEGAEQTEDPLEKESGGDQTEIKEKEGEGSVEAAKNGDDDNNNGSLSSFQQHSSSKNAFTGLAGTQSSGSSFSFGVVSQDGSSGPLFGFGLSNSNNTSSLFGASGSSIIKKSEGTGFPPKQEVSTETGEENEKVAFSADSIMFEYLDGGWRERGKGEVKVNVSSNGCKARLVMRAKGNYRLILNASLYPEMKLASMDKKGITFACVNSEGREGLSTFALKFKDPTIVDEFRVAVDKHKESKPVETAPPLKTPENSPTATDAA
ncbi:hypothetical protein F2Q68_00043917 [Brassica cretica]|uniref:RanBD1 domain-containing protein n=1 Tax=Brassica cretica TaxID=69181 RepID=A0A8S9LJ90_BRACR|nr:hypothetical protein F2Q68_00043917 [Brassica cretica]